MRIVTRIIALIALLTSFVPGGDQEVVVVFLGDSYTAGAGASSVSTRWSSLVAGRMGWTEVNMAYGGTGYLRSVLSPTSQLACAREYCPSYSELIDEVVEATPDIVIVNGGRNEASSVDATWHVGVDQFFDDLRAALPTVGIVATSPIWDDDPALAIMEEMRGRVRTAVVSVGGTYVTLGDPLLGRPDYVAADGVHPNDDGHAAIAAAFFGSSLSRTRPPLDEVHFPGSPRSRP